VVPGEPYKIDPCGQFSAKVILPIPRKGTGVIRQVISLHTLHFLPPDIVNIGRNGTLGQIGYEEHDVRGKRVWSCGYLGQVQDQLVCA